MLFFFQNAKGHVQICIKDTEAKCGTCSKLSIPIKNDAMIQSHW